MSRVLHVITGLGDGGAESVLHRLVTGDRQNSHQVVSLTDSGKYGAKLREAGIPVEVLGMPRGRFTLGGLRQLHRLIRNNRAEVVQTWMYHSDLIGGAVARLAGIRAVVWGLRNTYLGADTTSWQTRLVARVCAWSSRVIPRRIVSCSIRAAEIHTQLGYDSGAMVIIPNGYDFGRLVPDPIARAAIRSEWKISPDSFVLGLVARWDPQKDHENWIAALAEFQRRAGEFEWAAVLVGSRMDDSNPELIDLISRHGLTDRILLLGPRTDVPAIMTALDLHVLSSKGEGFPNVVAEAMACGTPGVVTDVGDAALVVGSTGWVVPPRSPVELADAMWQAAVESRDRLAWKRRTEAARSRVVEEFGLDRMISAYQRVWADVGRSSV